MDRNGFCGELGKAQAGAGSRRRDRARLTSRGLRHTLDARLREAGADDRTIADILGQRSASMARLYSEIAALPDHARDLVSNLNLTGKRSIGVHKVSTPD